MKGLLLQLVFLTLLLVYFQSASAQQCTPGFFEFTNQVVTPDYVTGYPTACVNGSYTPICNQTTLGLTELFYMCFLAGINTTVPYVGTPPNVTLPPFNATGYDGTVTAVSCSESGCSFSVSECTAGGYLAVTCSSSTCDFPIALYNNETFTFNGVEGVNGTVGQCEDGVLFGYCDVGNIADGAARYFCNAVGYLDGQQVQPLGSGLPSGALYYTNFSCLSTPYGPSNCTDGSLTTNPACSDGSLLYSVMCLGRRARCNSVGLTLNFNTTMIFNNTEYITGIPTQCEDGFVLALCNDDSITQETSDAFCQSFGYNSGRLLMTNSTLYGTLPQGTTYYTNYTCPPNFRSLDDCQAIQTDCLSDDGTQDYVLQCSRPYRVCSEGDVRFTSGTSGTYYGSNTRTDVLSGNLEICVNGQYRYLCGQSNVTRFNASDIVAAACRQLGYVNSSSNYTQQLYSFSPAPVIDSISCPYNGSLLSNCSINTTTDPNSCYGYDRAVAGTCNRITPACTRLFQMADRGTFQYANGSYVRTGRIEACVDNTFYPVCANGLNTTLQSPSPSSYQLNGVCRNIFYSGYEYFPGQYIGAPSDYYNSTSNSRVISSISCPNGVSHHSDCNITFSDSGCSSYGNDAVISCIDRAEESFECSGGFVTLRNYTDYRSPYGPRYVIGRVVACVNGSYVTVCNDTAFPEYFASQACNQRLSSSTNYTIVPFDPVYLNGDTNLVINNCSNTPMYSSGYTYCNNTVSDGTCSNGSPLIVRCEAECQSHGRIRLTERNTVYYDNGTSGTTGNVEFCTSGRWRGVCHNLNDSYAYLFCRQFGYNNGSFISSNPGGDSSASSYVNISNCFTYYNTPSSCSASGTSFPMCSNTTEVATLYCYDAVSDRCSNNVRFGNNYYYTPYAQGRYPNHTTYTIGNIELCVNGSYYDLCADQLTPEQALLLCRSTGGSYNRAYLSPVIGPINETFSYDPSSDSVANFSCPYSYFSSSCSFDLVYGNGCANNGGVAVLSCINDVLPPTCNTGSLRLQDRGYGYLNNGTAFTIGRPSVCYNNSYIPYCTEFNSNTARAFCGRVNYFYGTRAYPIFGSVNDYGSNDQSSLVVSNLTCPVANASTFSSVFGSCDNATSVSNNGGCSGFEEEPVISCINRPVPCHLEPSLNFITSYYTNTYVAVYQVSLCIGDTRGDVCANGITNDIALLFCRSQGSYFNTATISTSYANRSYSRYSDDYANFNCPPNAGSLSSCSADNVTTVSNCSLGYGGILVVECSQTFSPTSTPSCYNGQFQSPNTYYRYNYNTSLYSVSGYLTGCVNGTYAPVCGEANIGRNELTFACYFITGLAYGYVGAPPNVSLSPLSVSNDSFVITDLSCNADSFPCMNETGDSCSSGYLAITCQQLCNGGSPQFYRNVTYVTDGIEYVTGIPILCEDGAIVTLCNDGTIYDDPARLFCDALGFENGTTVMTESSSFGTLPNGTIYYSNYTCPPDAVHYDNCTSTETTNPQCSNSSYNYVIQCSRRERVCSGGFFLYNRVNTSSPGINSVTGVAADCVDNVAIYGVCNSVGTISDNVPRLFCNETGYEYGRLVSVNDTNVTQFGSLPQGSVFIANLTCPDNATSFDDCPDPDYTLDPQCYEPERNYIVECYSRVPPCHLQPYLNYIDYSYYGTGYTDTYQVGLCFNYTFGDLCTAGITNEVATLICRNRGYTSGAVNTSYYANSTYSRFGVSYAEFGCPSNASSLSSCYDNFTTVSNCSMGYGGYLVLSCTYSYGGVSSSSSVASPTPSPTISATINSTGVFTSPVSTIIDSTGVFTSSVSTTIDSTGVFTSSVSTIIDSTGVFTSSVSITPTPTSTPGVCNEGDVRFTSGTSGTSYSYNTRTDVLSGNLEICVNGQYRYLCGQSNVTGFNASDIVAAACLQLGYVNSSSNYTLQLGSFNPAPVIDSISCPYNGSRLSQCSINTTTETSCYGYERAVAGTCNRITPACTRLFQMADRGTFQYANGSYVRTGRIEACVDNVFYPVCANGLNTTLQSPSPSSYQLDGVCRNIFYSGNDYFPGQYIGALSDYYNSTSNSRVISSISCPQGAYRHSDCNITFSNSGCSSYGNDAVISCIDRAEETFECSGSFVTFQNYTDYRSPYGSRYVIGRVVACVNGSYVTVCNNTAFPEYFASQACNQRLSSSTNYTIVPFDPLYLNGDTNLVINNCSSTPMYSSGYTYCNNAVRDGTCSNGSPLIVRCEAECQSHGQVRLTERNTVYYDNGTSGTTGNLEFCSSGRWQGACHNLNDSYAYLFCRQFGYNNGSFISSNPGGNSSASSYVNISNCFTYYNTPSSCSASSVSFPMCSNTTEVATLYCYDAVSDRCSNNVRFGNNYYYTPYAQGRYPNHTTYTIGNIELCVNGSYYDLCADQLTPEQALLLCRSTGGSYNRAYLSPVIGPINETFSYDPSSDSVANFSCPYSYFSSSCSFDLVYGNGCANNGGVAVLSCINDVLPPTCNTGSLRLQDRGYGYLNNGTAFTIGRPSVCYNNSYIPYCTEFNSNTARAFCGRLSYFYGTRAYPIFGSVNDYGSNDQSSLVVSNLTCPVANSSTFSSVFGSCDNATSVSNNGGCSGFEEEPVISCINRPVPCHLEPSLNYITSSYTNNYVAVYQVGVCIGDTRGDVCANGITNDVALLFCRSQGSSFNTATISTSYANRTYSRYSNDYANFNCPSNAGSLSSCSADNVTTVSNCSLGYGGILVVECSQTFPPTPSCYNGQFQSPNSNYYYNYNTSLYSVSGYLTGCVNGTYAPVCGEANIGRNELTFACYFITGLAYGYVGTPPSVSLSPLSVSNDSFVITDLTCTTDIFPCMNQTGDSCSSGYLAITCQQLCNGFSPRFYSNVTYVTDGIEYVTGIPVLCEDGAIGALCNDGTIYDDPARLFCDALGFENGTTVMTNSYSFDALPNGTTYYSNYTCPSDAVHYDNCTANETTNPQCSNSSYNYVIQCSRRERVCSGGLFLYNSVNTSSPGINSVIGVAADCVDNVAIYGVCNSVGTISDNVPRLFCNETGYEYGRLVSVNDTNVTQFGSLPQGSVFIANLTCPDNATSFDDCPDPGYTTDPRCYEPERNYIVECYSRVPPCHLQPYLNYIDYSYFGTGYTDTYQIGLCFNYTFGDLCTAGITNEVATLICRNRGYTSGAVNTSYYANSTYPRFGVSYAEFGCPSNASSLSSCYDNFTTVSNCSMGYGGYLVLSCTYSFGGVSSSSVASPTPSPTISATIDSTGVFTSSVSTIIDSTGVFTSSVSAVVTSTSAFTLSASLSIQVSSTIQPSATTSASFSEFTSTVATTASSFSVSTSQFSTTTSIYTSMIKNTFSVSTSSASFSSSSFSLTPTPSSTPVAGDRCYSSEGRFGNRSSFNFYPGSRSVAAGRVEVCPNSRVFTPVCSDAVDDEFANAFCQSVYGSNYYPVFEVLIGSRSDYSLYNSTYVITNISCSYDYLSSCSYTTNSTDCTGYGGVAIFSCRRNVTTSTSECSDGNSFTLLNYTRVTFDSSAAVATGRVVGCRNSRFVDICADDSSDMSDLERIAQRACDYITSNSRATIIPWRSENLMSPSGVVISNISCDGNYPYSLSSCSYDASNMTQCSAGRLTVSCQRTCSDNNARLVNERVEFTANGSAVISGRLEICINGEWAALCDDETLSDRLADLACNSISYQYNSGMFLSANSSFYGSNARVYSNFTCRYGYSSSSIYDCTNVARLANDTEECVDSNAVLQCFRPSRSCYSSNQDILYSAYVITSDGRSGRIGRPVTCVNGQEATYCNNTINSTNIGLICSRSYNLRSGYPYPIIGSAQDYGVNTIPSYITGLSCPANNYYTDGSCQFTLNSESCAGYGGTSIITCINGPSDCNSGYISITRGSYGNGNINDRYFVTGYPQYCVLFDSVPICREGVSDEELRYICYRDYGYYNYSLTPLVGSMSDFTAPNTSRVVTDLSCPVFSRYDRCNATITEGNCDDRDGPLLLTCIQTAPSCDHGSVRIVGGPNNYTGRPEFCYFGTWRTICGIGFDRYDAAVTCSLAGFNHDLARNLSYGSYGYNSYRPVLAGLQCTGREGSFSNCTPINGEALDSCGINQTAAVACEPIILNINTTVNGTATLGPNTNLTLTCTLDYEYLPTEDFEINSFGWYRNGARLSSVPGRYNLTETEIEQTRCEYSYYYQCRNRTVAISLVLVFENLMASDAGEYTCRVNLTDFNFSRTVVNTTTETLNIIAPPMVSARPQNLTVLNGTGVTLNCTFTSRLTVTTQWFYASLTGTDQRPLISDSRIMVNPVNYLGNYRYYTSLTIPAVMSSDAGGYQCVGTSSNGMATATGSLVVLTIGTVDLTTQTRSVTEGDTITLSCSVTNRYPPPQYFSWFRNNNLLAAGGRISISSPNTATSQLVIQDTLTGDTGSYSCRVPAVPPLLPSLTDSVSVTVAARNECIIDGGGTPCVNGYCVDEVNDYYCMCPDNFIGKNCETPVTVNSPPTIVTPPQNQDVPLSSLVNLTCFVTGAPQPAITWYFDGTPIMGATSPVYIIDSIEPSQRGMYSCRAQNSEGMDSASALVTINDISQYSTTLTATGSSSRRRRQLPLPPAIEAVYNQTRESLVGAELVPGSGIVVADITYAFINLTSVRFIFTLRVPPNSNTDGVTASLNNVTAGIAAQNTGIMFTPVARFDGCPAETLLVAGSSSLSIMWPEVRIGAVARPVCPCGDVTTNFGAVAMRRCNGTFDAPGVWLTPNTTQCNFDPFTISLCQISENNNPEETVAQLSNITANTSMIDPVDIGIISTLIEDIADDVATNPDVVDPIMDTLNNVLDVSPDLLQQSQQSSNGSQKLINTVERIGANIPIINESVTVVRSQVAVRAERADPATFRGATLSISLTTSGSLGDNSVSSTNNTNSAASVSMPPDLLNSSGVNTTARLSFAAFTNPALFTDSSASISSIVLSADLIAGGSRVPVQGLTNEIRLSFAVNNSGSGSGNTVTRCAFWDTTILAWSEDGVRTEASSSGYVCYATHLSSFGVIQREAPVASPTVATPTPTGTPTATPTPTPPTSEEYTPEPILFVGLIISMILILIAVISHLASDSQRHCPEGRLLATSHITLIVLYFVFVFATAASYTDSTGFCGTFAGFFHYFSLVYFMWLVAEGFFYAVKLRMGIGGNPLTRHYFIISLILALVLPAIIVIISAGAGYDYYAMANTFCRPQMYPFYYGYVLPMIVLFLLTFLTYVISFFLIYCSGMTSAEKQFRKDSVISHFYVGLILTLVFALVWIFAIVGTQYNITGSGSAALQYVFSFAAMIHALILLILTFARTADTRATWRPVVRLIPGRSGKYDFASDPAVGTATRRETQNEYGLETSGKYLTDESKAALAEEKKPLAEGTDGDDEPRYVTTAMTEKPPELGALTVVANEDALANDEELDKKTEL